MDWESDQQPEHREQKEELPPIEVPEGVLSPEALQGLIESFVLREGTDYGDVEISHEAKMRQVHVQLRKGEIKIVFDPNTETVTLMTQHEWRRKTKPPS